MIPELLPILIVVVGGAASLLLGELGRLAVDLNGDDFVAAD